MSYDNADQMLAQIKESKLAFEIQSAGSLNNTNYCQLLICVHYAQMIIMNTELRTTDSQSFYNYIREKYFGYL